uniref:ABC transporter substrate-binding protein n=2 Tax=Thermorudis TaxID=1649508 RepID=A0A831T8E5_9BACT
MLERRLSRRAMLRVFGGGLATSVLLSACRGEQTPTTAPAATPTSAPAATPTAAATPTGAAGATTPTTAPAAATPTVSAEPIRLGILLDLSGPAAPNGEGNLRGLQLALEQAGMTVAGRTIQTFIEDSASQPEQALTKARQLVERDRVHLLAGITLSNQAAALKDYLVQNELPTIVTNAGLQALTRDPAMRSPYIFRVAITNGQQDAPMASYAYNTLGYQRVAVTAADYAAGHEHVAAFRSAFEKAGGQIVDEVYAPFGTQDFGPYLQRLGQLVGQVDAIYAFHGTSTDAIRFIVQYQEFGLKDQIPLVPSGENLDQSLLSEMGDAALDLMGGLAYTAFFESPENQAFVEAFQAKHNSLPGKVAYSGYLGGLVILEALESIDGQVEDKQGLLQALKQVQITGPAGEFRFHPESQGAVVTIFICRVEQVEGGQLGNVVVEQVPNVDDLSF